MTYYSSETCGFVNGSFVYTGCTSDYAQSDVKYEVDAWASAQAPQATEARLITRDELITDLGCSSSSCANSSNSWLYNSNYWYWTSSSWSSSSSWIVDRSGRLFYDNIFDNNYSVVRPVITISKSLI